MRSPTVSWLTRSCFYRQPFAAEPIHSSVIKVLLTVYHNIRYTVNMAKKKTSIRLSETAQTLLEQLAERLGISQSAVIEQAIRALATREGLPPVPTPKRNAHSSPR